MFDVRVEQTYEKRYLAIGRLPYGQYSNIERQILKAKLPFKYSIG